MPPLDGISRPLWEIEPARQDGRVHVVTAPAELPVTVDELKVQARTLFPGESDPFAGAEDTLLTRLIGAATDELDGPTGWLGRSLVTQTLRLSLDKPPPRLIRLPYPPVSAIVSITYYDTDDVLQTVDAADYQSDLDAEPALVWPTSDKKWPSSRNTPGRFRVDYTAGYGAAGDVPDIIRQAILIAAATLYRDRELTALDAIHRNEYLYRQLENWRRRLR